MAVRGTQVALLVVFLVLWEVLPRAQIINPVLTSYPSALWPTFLELLKHAATGGYPDAHMVDCAGDRARLHRRDGAGHHYCRRAVVVEFALRCSIPISSCQRDAEDGLRADLLYLARRDLVDLRHVACHLAFVTILMIYSGLQGIDPNKIKLAQTFGPPRRQVLTKVVLPGSVPTLIAALKVNAGLSLVGVVVGEFQSATLGLGYLIQYGSQIFKLNIVMTAVTILALVSSAMYLAISWLEAAVMRRR